MADADAWSLDLVAIKGVLKGVGTYADTLSADIDATVVNAETAVTGTASCPIIGQALLGFFEHYQPTLTSIGDRINNSMTGVTSAAMWYEAGDMSMAAEQQAGAALIAGTGAWVPTLPPQVAS